MAGNENRKIVSLCFIVRLLGAIATNASGSINMLEYPEAIKTITLGQNLELHWKYQINRSPYNNWKISLYEYNFKRGVKTKQLVLFQSGLSISNPNIWPEGFRKLNMELSFDEADISVLNATFDYSNGGYGIIFQDSHGINPDTYLEKFTEINVVELKEEEVPSQHMGNGSCLWPLNFLILFMALTFAAKNV